MNVHSNMGHFDCSNNTSRDNLNSYIKKNYYKGNLISAYLTWGKMQSDFERLGHNVAVCRSKFQTELPEEINRELIKNNNLGCMDWLNDTFWESWSVLTLHSDIYPKLRGEIGKSRTEYDYADVQHMLLHKFSINTYKD